MSLDSKTRSLSFATVDVFTTERFRGNPLAIVSVPRDLNLSQDQKQLIAREFNFSETVFLHEDSGSPDGRQIDIFTTTEELPFAGHPIIGTIYYIGQIEHCTEEDAESILLSTKAGTINAEYNANSYSRSAIAVIPQNVHIHQSRVGVQHVVEAQPQLTGSLSGGKERVSFPIVSIVRGMTYILIELPDIQSSLEHVQVDRPAISSSSYALDEAWSQTFIGTYFYVALQAEEEGLTSIRTRMIEPGCGEDPATGSAACTLGSYLALQAGGHGTTYQYQIEQGVEMGRHSQIIVHVTLDEKGTAVKDVQLLGTAVLVTRGTINF
ncbi:hypothetical protein MMC06_006248 [Schaereria dolodes]|nr:hypothetical protein [Schaereria dolodes]